MGLSGATAGVLRDGDKQIPIVARLRLEERARLEDVSQLSVAPAAGGPSVPIGQVAAIVPAMEPVVLRRRNFFPCVTVSCFPTEGHLASEVVAAAEPEMRQLESRLPAGYTIEQGGEQEEQIKAFLQLVSVLVISVVCIYIALVFEFKNAVKPLTVFAAVPYGMVGSVIGLRVMDQPFGFMAFLGIISLVGVLVSHIIVLFDFIEGANRRGDSLETALLDAGVQRLRPILITVGATVTAFIPLALHGGPLWQPLCYAQIGGLLVGAVSTLLLVPMLYTIFVRDWKLVRWEPQEPM
jgi:multidrug efflux pump subunit AcrB